MAKRGLSSVQRTLNACRQQGRFVDKAEQWLSFGRTEKFNADGTRAVQGKRRDLFGFIDIVAIDPSGIVAIQACTQSGAKHMQEIIENEFAHAWIKAGATIELWVWRKLKVVRGGKQMRWTPKIIFITEKDFDEDPTNQPLKEL